jgi:hypothetical protein
MDSGDRLFNYLKIAIIIIISYFFLIQRIKKSGHDFEASLISKLFDNSTFSCKN